MDKRGVSVNGKTSTAFVCHKPLGSWKSCRRCSLSKAKIPVFSKSRFDAVLYRRRRRPLTVMRLTLKFVHFYYYMLY